MVTQQSIRLREEITEMKELGRYDTEMQMFVEEPKDPSLRHLLFQKHLIDHGARTEMDKIGPKVVFSLQEHIAEHGSY